MRALFINPGGIGDQILLLPTVKLLKEKYPNCMIDLLTEPRSECVANLTNLFRKVKVFDFKEKNPNILRLIKIIRARNYKYIISTGSSYKANLVAFLGNSNTKIGFYSGVLSNFFLTQSIKLNTKQYATNMFAELLLPIFPELKNLIQSKDLIPEIKLNPEAIQWAKEILVPRIQERYYAKKIFIHPGVSKLSIQKNILKSWPGKNWAALIEKLLENKDNNVILLGGKDDTDTINEIHKRLTFFARPKNFFDFSSLDLSIEKLAALIGSSDLLVCADSVPMHIGVALGKKIVSFFGPTDPKKLLPKDPRFIAVHVNDLECRPCLFDTRKKSCSKPECLGVLPETMLSAINKVIHSETLPC
ncbi:MAG: glycosyltransferase family 9 protein [Candidatus Melainabacteria bacterium]|nr:glycosyltransferase family 9 protein [Candidatus Melainabacteria bacterium]